MKLTGTRALLAGDGEDGEEVLIGALRTEVRDLTGRWRDEGRYTPRSDSWLRSFDPAFSRELAARRLLGIPWPRRFGGRAGSNVMRLAVTEELLRAGAPVAAHWVADRQIGPAILRHGSDRLRAEILPGITADMDSPGIRVSPITDLAGEHHFNEVLLEDVFIPAHRVLGQPGAGWGRVVEQLSFERGGPERVLSTYPLLVSLLAELPGTADPELARKIGTLAARLAVMRRMCVDVAREMDRGKAPTEQSATLKYLGSRFERDVIEVARPLLGTPQAGPDSAFGQALLASPGFSIRGGASDVLLSIIARQEQL